MRQCEISPSLFSVIFEKTNKSDEMNKKPKNNIFVIFHCEKINYYITQILSYHEIRRQTD